MLGSHRHLRTVDGNNLDCGNIDLLEAVTQKVRGNKLLCSHLWLWITCSTNS